MYRKPHVNQLAFENFVLLFDGKLRSDNRLVILAKQISWVMVETMYAQQFSKVDMDSPAKSSHFALGVLILKERLDVTDRELVEQITENPYLKYFFGRMTYQAEAPFHHALLTTFRKRFTHDSLGTISEAIARLIAEQTPPVIHEPTHAARVNQPGADEVSSPKGQLLLDATCLPADIKDPTDLNLLYEDREKTEELMDHLHACCPKPRKYRQNAWRAYLRVAKARKPKKATHRQGFGNQRFGLGRLMAKLALTSETMTEILFLVMNVEHLTSRAIVDWLFSWWQGLIFSRKALLMNQGNTRHADFRDGNADVVECRGARMVLLAV